MSENEDTGSDMEMYPQRSLLIKWNSATSKTRRSFARKVFVDSDSNLHEDDISVYFIGRKKTVTRQDSTQIYRTSSMSDSVNVVAFNDSNLDGLVAKLLPTFCQTSLTSRKYTYLDSGRMQVWEILTLFSFPQKNYSANCSTRKPI